MKLLLIEDEPLLVETLQKGFQAQQFLVDTAQDGEQGLHLALEYDYDIIILDLGLPLMPGLKVLEAIRAAEKTLPILILSARNSWQERVEGLQKGANDYLGKPFHFEELLARVHNLTQPTLAQANPLSFISLNNEAVSLEPNNQVLSIGQTSHQLTATEFQLLHTLFLHPQQVFSKQILLQKISDHTEEKEENLIEVYIRRLRKYLGKEAIKTLRGQGYRLTLSPTSNP